MSEDSKLNDIIKRVFASLDDGNHDANELEDNLPAITEFWSTQSGEPMKGQVIGEWRIESLLGKGGMSVVYLVQRNDDSIQQQAALKILPIELASQQVVERFVRERQILVDLDHPNIAKLLDLGVTESNIPWYVMAYIKGQDIIGFISEMSANLTQKTNLFKQVCEAIAHAHDRGVVHRDIKPGNILVNDNYEVKVLDFGIALKDENTALTMTGAVMGTPGYMSPEQSKGQNHLIDARSDVFSLGTLFYHMLAGNKPFSADSAAEMGFQIINDEPLPLPASIPGDLKAIVQKCMSKDADQRYPSAISLLQDIKAYMSGDVIQAKPVSWFGYWVKKGQKYPKTTGLVFTLMLVSVLALATYFYQNHLNSNRLKQAELFVQQAETIKNQVRRIHMLPVHNVQPEYERIRAEITHLQQQISNSGVDQSGLTDLALGSAYLSMRDYDLALQFLQQAQDKGWQSVELDRQLGYARAVEWSYQLKKGKRIKDEDERALHLASAKVNHYNPAVELLGKTQQQSHFLAGRLAWIEERYDDAIEHYQLELTENPWHHEAAKQISEVYMNKFRTTGATDGYDAAIPFMDKSNEFLNQAILIGRSDPLNHVSRCTNAGIDIQIKRYLKKYDAIPQAFNEGMQACENALVLEPSAFSPWANMNLLLLNQAQMFEAQEQTATDVYQQALDIAERGLQLHPTKIPLMVAKIKPLTELADAAIENGDDPSSYFQQAMATADEVIATDEKSSQGWKELARVHWAIADFNQFDKKDYVLAQSHLKSAQQAYLNQQQSQISVTSQLNAALIESQLAQLHIELAETAAAIKTMQASIERRIKHLPSSKNYFSYHQSALEDGILLFDWFLTADNNNNQVVTELLQSLVVKTCVISGLNDEQTSGFNAILSQANLKASASIKPCEFEG
ncbi:protein kinase [Marinicella sp. S1101]|uniref:serine/threonine-protein kinase n=1 Tax=Marinicella marina TaxID=2996016 RepID=UPI002260D40F|nr:serine/threonine-protein kinase [Marinicella marina]MCX7552541.1 protein kinase [Marinicella marina]